MNTFTIVIICILAAWNIIIFAMYGVDKFKAKHDKSRIRETTMIWPAFAMGGVGALFGMCVFSHKTKHFKFKILIPIAMLFNIAVVIGGFYIANGHL